MVEREREGLIQDVLDGVATPEQVARLEAWLERDPAARARHQEMSELFEALKRVPRVEAPHDLRQNVLRALPPAAPGARAASSSAANGFRVRLAYVFAAGLAAGVVGMGALSGLWKTPEPSRNLPVEGSMLPREAPSPGPGAVTRTWEAGAIRVDGTSWRVGSSRLATFQVRGGDAEIVLGFDPAGLIPVGFRQVRSRTGRAAIEHARVVIQGVDHGEYVVEFVEPSSPSPPLEVTVHAGGQAAAGPFAAPQAAPRGGR